MTVSIGTLQEQLADAVQLCRRYRHQDGCQCYAYRNKAGEAFCTANESSWSGVVDRLIDKARTA
ncbi:hypothetical protein AB4Z39_10700 [Mycobacterium adipatum]|uniref:hypothetical protein n=1 Tax=Mycobacterium adipatum TaxID=1682113 RepID=UPI0034E0D993